MQLQLHKINGEDLLIVTLFGRNRGMAMVEKHREVMKYLNLAVNYLEAPFPGISHGNAAQQVVNAAVDIIKPTYIGLMDFDNLFLKREVIDIVYDSIKYKNAIWSCSTQSNHKKNRITNSLQHSYASQASLFFATELYDKVGRPDLDHWSDGSDEYGGDTCEKFTYAIQEKGYGLNLLYPSSSIEHLSDLDAGFKFGRGNFYGPQLVYHQMCNNDPRSEGEFLKVCDDVLAGKYE